jgi:dihydroorotase
MTVLIKNGRVIDPKTSRDEVCDVLVNGAIIERVGGDVTGSGANRTIDATGLIVAPGLVDVHAHLREPGYEWKETIKTGTMAAARGGFTSVVCMANTDPVNDNKSVTEYIMKKAAAEGAVRVFPCGAITKGLKGVDLSEMAEMAEAGAIAISEDGKSVKNANLLLKGMEYAKLFKMAVISHCEDDSLAQGFVHEGFASLLSGLDASPSLAEEIVAQRDIALAQYVDSPIHITHISSAGTVRILREGKGRFGKVTGDTCPHYFTLPDEATLGYDTNAKVNPPLRSRSDIAAIKEGLRDGTIDIIATDHAPHDSLSKDVEFNLASYGISGFETAFALSLSLVHEGVLDLKGLLTKMTVNPARLLSLPYGELAPGKTADLIIFSDTEEWTVDKKNFISKGKNTPFEGFNLRGKNLLTMVGGRIVYTDPEFKG